MSEKPKLSDRSLATLVGAVMTDGNFYLMPHQFNDLELRADLAKCLPQCGVFEHRKVSNE
jgi:hypothetical protein